MAAANCPYDGGSLVVADYLAGRLSDAEARAFEEHSFACDRCFHELQRATELRAAAESDGATAGMTDLAAARPRRLAWAALGMAAAVTLALGIWFTQPVPDAPRPDERVYRDATQGGRMLPLKVSRDGDSVTLSWPSVDRADRYRVRVWNAGGEPLFEQDATEPTATLPVSRWRDAAGADGVYVQVVALDELQQAVARSDVVPL